MTNYSRGADFERAVKAYLEQEGYFVVRSAGSHGVVDLLALSGAGHLAVQCKINGQLAPNDRKRLMDICRECRLTPIKAWRPKRGEIRYDEVR
jgi:Holliday junction resolvase